MLWIFFACFRVSIIGIGICCDCFPVQLRPSTVLPLIEQAGVTLSYSLQHGLSVSLSLSRIVYKTCMHISNHRHNMWYLQYCIMYHIHEHVELHHSKKFTWFHQFSSGFSCRREILAKTASSARRRTSQNCGLHRICLVRPLGNCPVPPHSLPSLHLKLQKWILKLPVEVYHSKS